MKENTFNFAFAAFGILVLVVVYFGVRFVSEYLATQQEVESTEYEFVLKADPKDVIFSEAYKNERGENNIKYAYLSDTVPPEEGEDIGRRTPDSKTFVLEQFTNEQGQPMEKLKTVFTAGPQFYKDESGWRQIEYATTTQEQFSKSGAIKHIEQREFVERVINTMFGIKPVFAVTSTFYPDPDAETSSVDGRISATTVGQASDTDACNSLVSNTSGSVVSATTPATLTVSINYITRTASYAGSLARIFLLFDTASLPDTASISSATLSVYVTAVNNGDNNGNDTVNVVTTTPASNTDLVSADYDNIGSVSQAPDKDLSTISTSAYNNFSLNATGIGNIAKTGVTKFGLRPGDDIAGTCVLADTDNSVTMSMAEETGTSQDPKLEVVYTTASFSFGQWFPF